MGLSVHSAKHSPGKERERWKLETVSEHLGAKGKGRGKEEDNSG